MDEKKVWINTSRDLENMTDVLFPCCGGDVHVSVNSQQISSFMDVDRSNLICFRCGETGHVRFQCLTFRVRMCSRFLNGGCSDRNCTYAHGEKQLRTPWKARCIRVIKQDGQLICIGCNSMEHTFRRCPLHQNVLIV